ncbi:MAG: DNA repair protein RadA [Dermatophilaceae bacterium]
MATKTNGRPPRASAYRCGECGWSAAKWVGRCGECGAWGTVGEVGAVRGRTLAATAGARMPERIASVDARLAAARATGVGEFDRVLGGGLVPGAVVLVAGEPGIGKSTLLLDVAARAAREGRTVLYVSAEESAAQVRLRADRIGAVSQDLYLAAETDLARILGQVQLLAPDLLVVDSVQTVASAEVDGSAGNVAQVREVAATLIHAAKSHGIAVLLVGHVTKDGTIAGPRALEHLVDVVVQFEGERHSRLRLVRAVKNRYGATDEVGCFDLTDAGILELPDPSGLFLSARDSTVPGTCVTVALEGRRPLVAEVQSLVAATKLPVPRRSTHGLDASRVAMVLAVLEQRARMPLGSSDIYVSTVGGARMTEPATDLAVALAVASAVLDEPLPPECLAVGEVGLAGELRPVSGMPRRLAEAARLGFRLALVPPGVRDGGPVPPGLRVVEVPSLAAATASALGGDRRPR